ncbi:type 4a pilus biogenesis protein PilO [Microbulbifer sp. JMSA003]|uniref:type 4a pilus biogenesis protein PilO n=1 Tax=Microbulbifer sp. JMSA003 TaxID=3243369 RepID=UPI00403A7625
MALADSVARINELNINDIELSRIGVWPLPGRLAVLALAAIIIIGGGYYFFVKDLYKKFDFEVRKERELFTQFERKQFQASNLDAYRAQLIEMEETFGALLKQLPKDTEVPGLLEDIDEYGRGAGLTINKVALLKERVGEFYVELPIRIEVEGGYHEFGAFVSGIAGMPRIVTLHNFNIVGNRGDKGLLKMTISAKTYRYKNQGEEG